MIMERFLVLYLLLVLLITACKDNRERQRPPEARSIAKEFAPTNGVLGGGEELTGAMTDGEEVTPNRAPEVVSIRLRPALVYPGTKIEADIEGRDADLDDIDYRFEWKKNAEVLPGEEFAHLDTAGFRKGDLILLTVTPNDGKIDGKSKQSRIVRILNSLPEISSFPPLQLSDGRFIYQVVASDADDDSLTYTLEKAPPGMTIGSETGLIRWDVPEDMKGSVEVKIVISDGEAGAVQGFFINLI